MQRSWETGGKERIPWGGGVKSEGFVKGGLGRAEE